MKSVSEMTFAELKAEIQQIRALKLWGNRYFAVDSEIQRRAVAAWVHQDVFGEQRSGDYYDPKKTEASAS